MDSFEINKVIAAIVVTVLIVFGISKVSDIVFTVKKPAIEGYKVEVAVANTSLTQASTESTVDIAALLALGSVENGKKIFKKCKACHSIAKDGKNKIGPALYSVVGRAIGGVSDYKYSKALASYGKEWTFEELNGFLIKPAKWIPANKMGFNGLKKPEDRASVILYLNENSDSPIPLP